MAQTWLTALEKAILRTLINRPHLLDDPLVRAALPLCTGKLGECTRLVVQDDPFVPSAQWVTDLGLDPDRDMRTEAMDRQFLLLNLAKWLHQASLDVELVASEIDSAVRGTPQDCVAEMRAGRPSTRRRSRTGAGVR